MTGLRLLPILLFAMASLFALKAMDLLGRGGLEVGGPAPAYAGSDVTDVRSGAKINDYAVPVALTWLADDPPPRKPAAWVKEWQQAGGAPPSPGIAAISAAVWGGLAVAVLLLAAALLWLRRRRAAPDDANARE